jgi:MFS family permease
VTGLSTLAASVAAGLLWDHVSPRAPFLQGAAFGVLGAVLLAVLVKEPLKEPREPLRRNG